jgi:hypothetical protein
VAAPVLRAVAAGRDLILSWPTNAAGFVLQSSTLTSPLSWNAAGLLAAVNGTNFTVTIPMTGGGTIYRLCRP